MKLGASQFTQFTQFIRSIALRSMIAASLVQSAASSATAQEQSNTPKTRPNIVTLHQWGMIKPQYNSDDFVVDNFEKPLEEILSTKELDDDSYVKTIAEIANTTAQKITAQFADKHGFRISDIGIRTQIEILDKIWGSIKDKFVERFPQKDAYDILISKNIILNSFLMDNIFIDDTNYASIETISARLKIAPNKINLFYTDIGEPIYADLCHPEYERVRNFLGELFLIRKECVPKELVYRSINDHGYWALGHCAGTEVFLCPSRIQEIAEINEVSEYQEKYTTIVNELLHQMMSRKFGLEGIKKFRRGQELAGENFGTEYTVTYNKEVEEALSDIVSLVFKPESFIDMLRSPYPFSSALASKIVKEKFPKTFDHLSYSDWGQYYPETLKEDFINELKKQGIDKPNLMRDLYTPALKELKVFALNTMKRFDELL